MNREETSNYDGFAAGDSGVWRMQSVFEPFNEHYRLSPWQQTTINPEPLSSIPWGDPTGSWAEPLSTNLENTSLQYVDLFPTSQTLLEPALVTPQVRLENDIWTDSYFGTSIFGFDGGDHSERTILQERPRISQQTQAPARDEVQTMRRRRLSAPHRGPRTYRDALRATSGSELSTCTTRSIELDSTYASALIGSTSPSPWSSRTAQGAINPPVLENALNDRWKCPLCGSLSRRKYELQRHLETMHTSSESSKRDGYNLNDCEFCHESFMDNKTWARHVSERACSPLRHSHGRDGSEAAASTTPGLQTSLALPLSLDSFADAPRMPNIPGGYFCTHPGCKSDFDTRSELNHHLRRHRPFTERPHRCEACQQRFLYRKDLKRHIASHSDARHFCRVTDCSYATKGFGRRDHLDRHMRTRHGDSIELGGDAAKG